jgi:pimeloyl-[acyl-carrier protein] synthase
LAGEPIEMRGRTIPPGEIVLGCLGAANRDPEKFTDPDRLDIRRSDNRHLSFGSGIHYCLGAALARMEAQIAIRELAVRFPRMRLVKNRMQWLKGLTFRGVQSLPVAFRQ